MRKAIQTGRMPSIILWGPPGTGKTTLAQIIAHTLKRPFHMLSAINSGVKDIRETIDKAKKEKFFDSPNPILFIDEIHRFSKSQQDSLLNAVEKGIITLTVLFLATLMFQSCSTSQNLNTRAPREVRRAASDYEKQGYKVAVGAPTIEMQITEAWLKRQETDENGYPKYFVGDATSVGETQIAAKLQATEAAKLDLAGQISTNVAALIENNIANSQINTEEAASVTKTVAASKSLIAQKLGRTLPLVEMYRNIGKNMEANVSIAYSHEMAKETAKQTIRKSLEEETEILQEKLERLMNF